MNRTAWLYQKSDTDACLFTERGDMAELLMVNPSTGASKEIYMYAPLKLLNKKKKQLVSKGYFMQNSISLCLGKDLYDCLYVN